MTYLTTILSWRQCTEIKHLECELCVLSNRAKNLIFLVCHTVPYLITSLIRCTFVLGKSFVFLVCLLKLLCNGSGIPVMILLCASTLIEIPIQGQ